MYIVFIVGFWLVVEEWQSRGECCSNLLFSIIEPSSDGVIYCKAFFPTKTETLFGLPHLPHPGKTTFSEEENKWTSQNSANF